MTAPPTLHGQLPRPTRGERLPAREAPRGAILRDVAVLDECPLVVHGVRAMLAPYVTRVRPVTSEPSGSTPTADATLWDPAPLGTADAATTARVLADPRHGALVLHTMTTPRSVVVELLERGCAAYVDKRSPVEALVEALLDAVAAHPCRPTGARPGSDDLAGLSRTWPGQAHGLSRREAEIIGLIARGLTNQDITEAADLSINTVKSYVRTAYQKIGVTRRSEAVRWGMEHGLDAVPRQARG